jgi:hypothetical protein
MSDDEEEVRPEEEPPPAPAKDPKAIVLEQAQRIVRVVTHHVVWARDISRHFLARFDPNDDPDAEPLDVAPLLALALALGFSVWMYWRWKFQPMQDLGHHVGLTAVVTDYGRSGSLYPALYEAPSPLNANSFLYYVAGYLGKVTGVTNAIRLCMTFYLVGVPLANLYALRVFGRSAWPAVLSVPFVYNMNYLGGFANLLFAAPFMVLTIPVFYLALTAPTRRRIVLSMFLLIITFMSHAHAWLWLGAVTFVITLGVFLAKVFERGLGWKARLWMPGKVALIALAAALPSLLLFYRWYKWSFGEGKAEGAVTAVTVGADQNFGAVFKPPAALFTDFWNYALKIYADDADLVVLYKLGILGMIAVAFSRLHRFKKPPVLELVFALTVGSYFFMPEEIATNSVVGSRQLGTALWMFAAAVVTPVPARVSRMARYVVILGILYCAGDYLDSWYQHMVKFERTEANGIEYVLEQTPYRQRLHYVKLASDWSQVFKWRPVWHVDKYYMADRLGQVADNPAIVSTSSIRYKTGVDPHRITAHAPDWSKWDEIWDNYELVLVRGWNPTKDQLDAANQRAVRIRKSGIFELWRKKGDWQQKGDGPPP